MEEKLRMVDTSPQGQRPPYRSILLGLIALQSSGNIAQVDIPAVPASIAHGVGWYGVVRV